MRILLTMQFQHELAYKPHLDGLRAISIALVLLYNLGIKIDGITLFQYGFIGVDMFMVLSGYLKRGQNKAMLMPKKICLVG